MAPRVRRRAKINGYPIDLVKSEQIKFASKVTDHPTESGQDITDNIRRLPMTIQMECLVSDTPIGDIATDPTRQLDLIEIESNFVGTGDILQDTLTGIADNVNVVRNALVPLPSEDAHQRLMQMWIDELPVDVECSRGLFKNCAIEDISEINDASTGGGLSFSVNFKVIRILEGREIRASVSTKMPTKKKPTDYGLSIDKLVDTKKVLWRKGKPPGLSPATDPKGQIVGQEIVNIEYGVYLHENRNDGPLKDQELLDFAKDLNRDSSLASRRGINRAEEWSQYSDERFRRADALSEARRANPGKNIDPALFGIGPGTHKPPSGGI